jgi:hypothetical protein
MKLMLTLLGAAMVMAFAVPPEADAAKRAYRVKRPYATYYNYYHENYRRPASVAENGLCQRDTGTPTSQLNFRNRCDTEEFWNRMQERGGGRR